MAITDVIKYEGDNNAFIWKYPKEDFNCLTQLIVHESQEAVFFMNGQALDLFGPGRYTLESQNIPLIGNVYKNIVFGKESPFHCEVYFINKAVLPDVKWGTDSKVRFVEPEYGIPLEIGACGVMNLQVSDSRKLLVKLVGTMGGIAWEKTEKSEKKGLFGRSQEKGNALDLKTTFHPLITTAIKSNLTPAIKAGDFDILEIDEHLMGLSKILQQKIEPGFEEYGLSVRQFYVTTVVLPEEDINYKKIRELHTISLQKKMLFAEADVKQAQAQAEADVITARRKTELERETTQTEILKREEERKILEAQTSAQAKMAEGAAAAEVERLKGLAAAEVMRAKGYTEKDILQADVQKAYAEGLGKLGSNAGGSSGGGNSIMNDMIGLGMGLKAAVAVTGQFSNIFDTVGSDLSSKQPGPSVEKEQSGAFCRNCGAALPENARFCMKCGTPAVNKCPSCGTELPPDAKFCLKCGTKVC